MVDWRSSARCPLLLLSLCSWPMALFAFTKVIVPAVYHEWNNGKPHWVTQPDIQQKFNYSVFAYQKLDPNGTNYFEYNHGTETGVYLKYIVDHYDNFPDVAIFVHAKPHEHQTNWLHMVGCISPNATWYNINHGDSQWTTRSPDYWKEDGLAQEQCWRDVLQTVYEMNGKDEEFYQRLPNKKLTVSATCCNQFLLSRNTVRQRPLHVWKELFHIIAVQPTCHMGEPAYDNLYEFQRNGNVKNPEKLYYEKFKESFTNRIGAYIPGVTGEHLSHVVFGMKELEMVPPSKEEICQNFIHGCPGSPCMGYLHTTALVKVRLGPKRLWYVVLHKGMRHNVPDMDTLEGLEIPGEKIHALGMVEVNMYPEGPALTPCDKSFVPNTCKDSVYYKALHNIE